MGRCAAQQQLGDLDRVALRTHRGPYARAIEEELGGSIRTPRSLKNVCRLCSHAFAELRHPHGQARRWRWRAGYPPAARFTSVTDAFGRVAADDRPVGHVLRDHCTRGNHTVRADRDAVEDDGVRADPDVVADRDAAREGGLPEDGPVWLHRVVEPEDRRMRTDAHPVAEPDVAAHGGERIDRRVVACRHVVSDICVCGYVRVATESEALRVHHCEARNIGVLAEHRVEAFGEFGLVLELMSSILLGRPGREQPGRVIEARGASVAHGSQPRRVVRAGPGSKHHHTFTRTTPARRAATSSSVLTEPGVLRDKGCQMEISLSRLIRRKMKSDSTVITVRIVERAAATPYWPRMTSV